MSSHEWFVEHHAAFVAGALDPDDQRAFADHLTRCGECARAVRELEHDLAWLPMGGSPVRPRPGFRWRAANRILGTGPRSRPPVWIPLGLAAAALLGLAVTWRQGSIRESALAGDLASARSRATAVADTLQILRGAARVMQASIQMDGHQGGLLIFADEVTHRWNVVVHGLPPAPVGEKYQFWFICEDGMVRGLELELRTGGPVLVTVEMPDRGGAVLGAALSMEPSGNRSDQPAGRELAHLML